jgi:AraC-like DNA-binding protein
LKAFIKNMTTVPSQKQVKTIVEDLGLELTSIDIGEIEVGEILSDQQYEILKESLHQNNFELISGKENILTEKIKNVIIEMIHYSDELPVIKYSSYISSKLKTNYTYLSKIFSKVKNITIEHFIIIHKIERVKQLLLYNEFTLSEIAWKLHYSSTAHLSAQFKKITGITPSLFKKSEYKNLVPLENL